MIEKKTREITDIDGNVSIEEFYEETFIEERKLEWNLDNLESAKTQKLNTIENIKLEIKEIQKKIDQINNL